MKVINIPAYSYFDGNSYRTDFYILTDTALLNKLAAEYPSGGYLYNASGEVYKDLPSKVNQIIGAPVFNPSVRLHQVYNKTHTPNLDYINTLSSYAGVQLDCIKITDSYDLSGSFVSPEELKFLNNDTGNISLGNGNSNYYGFYNMYSTISNTFGVSASLTQLDSNISLWILPDNIFVNNRLISRDDFINQNINPYRLHVYFKNKITDGKIGDCDNFFVECRLTGTSQAWQDLNYMFGSLDLRNSGINTRDFDESDPYGHDGTSYPGGGDGTLSARGLDAVDPAEIPALPSVSAADLGFVTMYNPTAGQLKNLADFMWSNLFDLNTYKKLFSDPMESIIGLAIVPINPTVGGSKNVMFGTIDSGVNMSYLSTNWASLDCGWCSIEKYIGAFLDSDPYTKVSIYLPFIGIRQLAADDVNGRMVHVVYHVDVLTGACAAFIEVEGRGVMYTYNGSCITNIPLTSVNFSGAIQNAVSAVISGIGTVAGMATGAAPITAMGVSGLLNSAANTALNSKPAVQRSGSLGGSAGIMSIMRPYLIIERPDISVPNNVQHYAGQTCNITMNLGSCNGFTMCEFVHVENTTGTSEEVKEIEALLKEGVYL